MILTTEVTRMEIRTGMGLRITKVLTADGILDVLRILVIHKTKNIENIVIHKPLLTHRIIRIMVLLITLPATLLIPTLIMALTRTKLHLLMVLTETTLHSNMLRFQIIIQRMLHIMAHMVYTRKACLRILAIIRILILVTTPVLTQLLAFIHITIHIIVHLLLVCVEVQRELSVM